MIETFEAYPVLQHEENKGGVCVATFGIRHYVKWNGLPMLVDLEEFKKWLEEPVKFIPRKSVVIINVKE